MSVTFPGYPQLPYTLPARIPTSPFQAPPLGSPNAALAIPALTSAAIPAPAPNAYGGAPTTAIHSAIPSIPNTPQQFGSLLKAAVFIAPAIFLARLKPSNIVAKELLPSDWKVWAKMGLSVASLSQVNKALNWEPPPWLSAFMNVALMTLLMRNMAGNRWKVIGWVGASVAALAQLNQYAGDKLKPTLEQKYGIPPWATQLALSAASMGVGIFAMPRWLAPVFREDNKLSAATAEGNTTTRLSKPAKPQKDELAILSTRCASGCCASPICLNEVVNNVSVATDGIKKQVAQAKSHSKQDEQS